MAENVLWLSPWHSDRAIAITASSAAMPASNLLDPDPTTVWRTTSNGAAWFKWQLTTAVAANCLFLKAGSLSTNATIQVRLASSDAGLTSAPGVNTGAVSAWPAGGRPLNPGLGDMINLIRWTNSTGYTWCRVDIVDSSPLGSTFHEIGRAALGRAWQPTANFGQNPSRGFDSADVQERTLYGQLGLARRGVVQRRWTLPFPEIAADEAEDGPLEFARLHGEGGDFFASLDPSATTRLQPWTMQCTFTKGQMPSFVGIDRYDDSGKPMWTGAVSLTEVTGRGAWVV